MPKPTLLYTKQDILDYPFVETQCITSLWYEHNEACPNREYTNQWALAIALPCGWNNEFARFKRAADKTLTQRLFIMSVAILSPIMESGQTTWQK